VWRRPFSSSPATYSADTTPVAVDLQGARSAVILINVGIGGITFDPTNKIEFVLKHGDDSVIGNHVAVAAADVQLDSLGFAAVTGGIVRQLIAAHAAGDVQKVGYIGGRRFLSLLVDYSGTHGTGTPISAAVVKSNLNLRPA
jgi:hypothetical protein